MAETFITLYQGNGGRIDIGYDYTQDIANNKTTLTVKAYVIKTNSSYYSYRLSPQTFRLTVNGVDTNHAWTFDFRNMNLNQRYLITTATREITHNSDGTISNRSASVYCATGTDGLGTINGSTSSISIATIPRTSPATINVSTQAIGSQIIISTNRASGAFTHKIYSDFYDGYWTLIADGITDSYSWTLPSSFANKIPNATSGAGRIAVDTYSGTSYIGTKIIDFTATVPNTASYQPSISNLVSAISGTGRDKTINKYVQNISKAAISFSRVANGGASIVSSSINIKRKSDNANSMTISSNSGTSGTLVLSGIYLITATATDSRGRSKTSTIEITVDAYAVPKINSFTAVRQTTTKTSIDTSRNGTYTYLSGNNPLTVVIAKRPRGGSYSNVDSTAGTTSGTFTGSYTNTGNSEASSFDFRLTVTDSFGNSAVAVITVPTSAIAFCINEDVGVGIGKIHEQGSMDVAGPIYFNGVRKDIIPYAPIGNGNDISYWQSLPQGDYFVLNGYITGQPTIQGFMSFKRTSLPGTAGYFIAIWYASGGNVYIKNGTHTTNGTWAQV